MSQQQRRAIRALVEAMEEFSSQSRTLQSDSEDDGFVSPDSDESDDDSGCCGCIHCGKPVNEHPTSMLQHAKALVNYNFWEGSEILCMKVEKHGKAEAAFGPAQHTQLNPSFQGNIVRSRSGWKSRNNEGSSSKIRPFHSVVDSGRKGKCSPRKGKRKRGKKGVTHSSSSSSTSSNFAGSSAENLTIGDHYDNIAVVVSDDAKCGEEISVFSGV